ncbi:TPA: hypothetical protein MIM88_23130 [Klebsiella pneumoniae]|nr:hypothetical protein [Klebsiella pneumoniae]
MTFHLAALFNSMVWSQTFSTSNGLASTDLAGIWALRQYQMSSNGLRPAAVERSMTSLRPAWTPQCVRLVTDYVNRKMQHDN